MKEAVVAKSGSVEIVDTPVPTPKGHEVLIKVVVAGSNPKDWKVPLWSERTHNSGDDIGGIVHAVGPKVFAFKPGDRVAAFHKMTEPSGAFAEYAIAAEHATFKIPEHISFEQGATIPLAAMTASVGLFQDLGLPDPWDLARRKKVPFLVYGASSATGAFAAQFAKMAGLGPVIGVAGAGKVAHDVCDYVVDYRKGEDALVKGIQDALKKEGLSDKVLHVFDAISENGSHEAIARVIDPKGGAVSQLLPVEKFAKSGPDFKYPEGTKVIVTSVGRAYSDLADFATVHFRFYSSALDDGRLKPHPHQFVDGGLGGVETGLKWLKEGKASGVKYVFKIEDTAGVGK